MLYILFISNKPTSINPTIYNLSSKSIGESIELCIAYVRIMHPAPSLNTSGLIHFNFRYTRQFFSFFIYSELVWLEQDHQRLGHGQVRLYVIRPLMSLATQLN